MIIGGLDVGTTGCKIALYNENCELLDTYYNEYDAKHQNGHHEIDFTDVRSGVISILKKAAGEYRIDALGVTSFGETFAMLDENDRILAPSMLYTDPRGQGECDCLCDNLGEDELTLLTGVKPHPMYSISKIMWHKNNTEAFAKCRRILLGEDFIVYTLTGKAQIDYSLAARTAAFDIEKKCWIDKVFETAGIDASLMSDPVPAGTVAGVITESVKNELGIDYDITVVNGCHDQVAGMIGSGIFEPDQAMDGTGTVECIPVILKKKPTNLDFYEGGYSVVPYLGDLYACYALSFTGGATLKWFRDNFAELEWERARKESKNVYAELDKAVSDKPTGILVLPHFAGAATPYMDNDSRAVIAGLSLEHTSSDVYKALMEGTTYEIRLNCERLAQYGIEFKHMYATGGGAASPKWLQIKADILNLPVTSLDALEVGACGTCMLTGVAIGLYKDLHEAKKHFIKEKKPYLPEKAAEYNPHYARYEKMYDSIRSVIGE